MRLWRWQAGVAGLLAAAGRCDVLPVLGQAPAPHVNSGRGANEHHPQGRRHQRPALRRAPGPPQPSRQGTRANCRAAPLAVLWELPAQALEQSPDLIPEHPLAERRHVAMPLVCDHGPSHPRMQLHLYYTH